MPYFIQVIIISMYIPNKRRLKKNNDYDVIQIWNNIVSGFYNKPHLKSNLNGNVAKGIIKIDDVHVHSNRK